MEDLLRQLFEDVRALRQEVGTLREEFRTLREETRAELRAVREEVNALREEMTTLMRDQWRDLSSGQATMRREIESLRREGDCGHRLEGKKPVE